MTAPPRVAPAPASAPKAEGLVPPPPWRIGNAIWDFGTPLVMGVLNATPDSFSDGGDYLDPEAALERAREMMGEKVDLIDLGGASSHPLAKPVSAAEELDRIAPVVEAVAAEVPFPLSIDTQRPEVAETCLKLGANLINDVSGLTDPEMARVAARHEVPLVIMYNNYAVPREKGTRLMDGMVSFFDERIALAEGEGARRLILDPGYGFGKTIGDNMTLLRSLSRLRGLRRPLLICTSRKGSLGKITGEKDPKQRLGATIASTLYAVGQGANMIRVHDVRDAEQALRTW